MKANSIVFNEKTFRFTFVLEGIKAIWRPPGGLRDRPDYRLQFHSPSNAPYKKILRPGRDPPTPENRPREPRKIRFFIFLNPG